jgi:hypothetical protein
MMRTETQNAVAGGATPAKPMTRLGWVTIVVGALTLIMAFLPATNFPAGVLAAVGLLLGLTCLIVDRAFNTLALLGTVMCSTAVTAAVIMGFIYGS